ncbi:MAG: neuraminidase-like domain-containing protein [Pseudomonadota bacterium]|nr:neuraminidase-like domain-containing protein [Pseudomonadota bacterium]
MSLIATSSVQYGAGTTTTIDVELCVEGYRGKSEFAQLLGSVGAMVPTRATFATLTADNILFLAAANSWSVSKVVDFVVAHRLDLEFFPAGPTPQIAEQLYGLLRNGWPRSVPRLLLQRRSLVAGSLSHAADANVISRTAANAYAVVVQAFKDKIFAWTMDLSRTGSLGALLEAAGFSDLADRTEIVNLYLTNGGSNEAFWSDIADSMSLPLGSEATLRTMITLAMITCNHAPMVEAVFNHASWMDDASLVATFSDTDWHALITAGAGVPAGVPGTGTAQEDTYVLLLLENAESAFPSRTATTRLAASTTTVFSTALKTFFTSNPTFELGTTPITDALAPDPDLKKELQSAQRLYRIAPSAGKAEVMEKLYAADAATGWAGVSSGLQVSRMGATRFREAVDALGVDAVTAREVYQKSRIITAAATAMYTANHPNLIGPPVSFLGGTPDATASTNPTNYESLFGSVSYCACEHCRSVLSPAAYLVDLLQWVDDRGGWAAATTPTGTSLSERRADLGTLLLTCENTHRALPYVDLVIEILENAVSPTPGTAPISTDAKTPELLATPQYVNEGAYTALAAAVFPQRLPFDLWLLLSRHYLAHLGVKRADLMRAYENTSADFPDADHIAMEDLRINEATHAILAGTTTRSTEQLWGYVTGSGDLTLLTSARTFLLRAELTHEALLDLLHCRFTSALTLTVGDECDLGSFTLGVTADADWNTISRFLRLSRVTGWSLLDTDKVANSMGWTSTTLNAGALRDLAAMKRILGLVKVEPIELATWFGSMDAYEDRAGKEDPIPSLWERTWLNPSLFPKAEIDAIVGSEYTFPFRFLTTGLLVGNPEPVATYSDKLKAALGVEDEDFTYASKWLGASWAISHADLGSLYARVSLSRALGLSVRHARRLSTLTGIDPFDGPTSALDFIEQVKELQAVGFDADELDYLAAHTHDYVWATEPDLENELARDRVSPSDTWKQAALGALRDAARPLYTGLPRTDDTRTMPSAVADQRALTDAALQEVLFDADGRVDTATIAAVLDLLEDEVGPYDAADRLVITTNLADFGVDSDALVSRLAPESSTDPLWLQTTEDRFSLVFWLVRRFQALRDREGDADGAKVRAGLAEVLRDDAGEPRTAVITALMDVLALVADTTNPYTSTMQDALSDWLGDLVENGDFLLDRLAPTASAVADFPLAYLSSIGDRYSYALWVVRRYQARARARALVVEGTSALLGRSRGSMEALREVSFSALADLRPTVVDASVTTIDFTDLLIADELIQAPVAADGPWDDIDQTSQAGPWAAIEVLYKTALLLNRLAVDEEEQAWWLASGETTGFALVSLYKMPLSASGDTDALVNYTGIKRAVDLFRLRRRLPGTSPTFAELLEDAVAWRAWLVDPVANPEVDFPVSLATRTGWSESDINSALEILEISSGAVSILDVAVFERLVDALLMARRAGVSPATIEADGWWTLGTVSSTLLPTRATADSITVAARARYASPEAWSAVARPLRDELREQQRQALVGYLLANETSSDARDASYLYGKYLIDVEMSPCALTSRVKQAACSVQLYVQRNLMGLETEFALNDDDREEWEWMKNYRVWEAARKVFLYPENWIEPELRDDKTPLFKAFESDVSQGQLTTERVEDALLQYLDKLLDVSRLHLVGYHWQSESDTTGDIDVLHVFARTRGLPAAYYYRRWEDRGRWTPWEKVECGVEGDHLLPVVHNRRLMLFWVAFLQDGDTNENASPSQWWNVHLSWAEYRGGKWSSKRVGEAPLSLQTARYSNGGAMGFQDVVNYTLTSSRDEDDNLVVSVRQSSSRLGYFTLNACTMEMTPTVSQVEDPRVHIAYAGSFGTALHPSPGAASPFTGIDVALGEVDPTTYELVGSSEYVRILDITNRKLMFAVSNQFHDYVSQLPFFVELGERAWFVVPEGAEDEAAIDDPETFEQIGEQDLSQPEPTEPEPNAGDGVQYTGGDTETDLALADEALAEAADTAGDAAISQPTGKYRFYTFHHPYVCTFIKEVRRSGPFGLYLPDSTGPAYELVHQDIKNETYFEPELLPTENVVTPYPIDDVDFEYGTPYSQYNWEIFFHVPFLVADRLAADQQFALALDWFHAVFDPRRTDVALAAEDRWKSYWKIRPFYEEEPSAPVDRWVEFTGASGDSGAAAAFEKQVAEWREDPFNPHLIARLRPGTYQKVIALKYLDTLIAWGDQLFMRDTIESINEATQLYIYAKQVLGDRPEVLAAREAPTAQSFDDLRVLGLDAFSNALVTTENDLFEPTGTSYGTGSGEPMPNVGLSTYFCIVPNDRLMKYWDTVDDRLFKIRHCMNIEGVFRQLPLFEPPIDPALLVKAAAAGLSIGAVLSGTQAGVPVYRFSVLLQKAQGFAASVRGLGQSLLSALEKRDAEALSLLRSTHELDMLDRVSEVRTQQLEEARAGLVVAEKALANADARKRHYQKLIDKDLISAEKKQEAEMNAGQNYQDIGQGLMLLGSILAAIPQIQVGVCAGTDFGGQHVERLVSGTGSAVIAYGARRRFNSELHGLNASRDRRKEDWNHQLELAKKDLEHLKKQQIASEIRVAIAELELKNHARQIENTRAVDEWMRSKYSNQELYDWMAGQVSALYFSSYQLAYEVARKAEACFRFELGQPSVSYIQFGHWDNARKGLLAGERLAFELERMDAAYLDGDKREFEVTKHVSLAQLDPAALLLLQETGECSFTLDEAQFDMDFAGHYFRRLQSASVTIAAAAGRHGSVNAELRLDSSKVRISTTVGSAYAESVTEGDSRFRYDARTLETIAISGGNDDSGLFRLDYSDPRYLPFQRKGVVSTWTLRFTGWPRQFDWSTVTDVILHVRYTARNGGDAVRTAALDALQTALNDEESVGGVANGTGLYAAFSAARDFPDAWHQFLNPTGTTAGQTLTLALDEDMLPRALGESTPQVDQLLVYLVPTERTDSLKVGSLATEGTLDGVTLGNTVGSTVTEDGVIGYSAVAPSLPVGTVHPITGTSTLTATTSPLGSLALTVTPVLSTDTPAEGDPYTTGIAGDLLDGTGTTEDPYRLDPDKFSDLVVVLRYGVTVSTP